MAQGVHSVIAPAHVDAHGRRALCNVVWRRLIQNVDPVACTMAFQTLVPECVISLPVRTLNGFVIMGQSGGRVKALAIVEHPRYIGENQAFGNLQGGGDSQKS